MPNSPRALAMPAGSRLLPRSTSAFTAPSSTTSSPRDRAVKASQCLRLASRLRVGNSVPTGSPAATRSSAFRVSPLQSTVEAPQRAALRAAESLVIMPPRPKVRTDPLAARSTSAVMRSTTS